ncbi:SMI1/KNR4 family protein [Clostridium botulinum]|nr:SMI1/KNR4 family protein [Clostridium botulinum]NFR15339.1 SMI1/KNR4 family protein [Clostridium botulinum]NFR43994.1 SMI1/KNR4 family protein [Clostridium botulinum]NFS50416.1 SMI1/KNR4 family protein [Clostridium botulinum]
MFNKELLKKAEEKCGGLWTGGVSSELIIKLSNDLEVNLPESYIEFLKTYGEGGVDGYIFGIEDESYSSAYKKTLLFRKEKNINKLWIVIAHIRTTWEEYLICIDTSRMKKGECPIIKYDLIDNFQEDFKENFYEYFNYKAEIALNK